MLISKLCATQSNTVAIMFQLCIEQNVQSSDRCLVLARNVSQRFSVEPRTYCILLMVSLYPSRLRRIHAYLSAHEIPLRDSLFAMGRSFAAKRAHVLLSHLWLVRPHERSLKMKMRVFIMNTNGWFTLFRCRFDLLECISIRILNQKTLYINTIYTNIKKINFDWPIVRCHLILETQFNYIVHVSCGNVSPAMSEYTMCWM